MTDLRPTIGRRSGALAALTLALALAVALLGRAPEPARGADDPALRAQLATALASSAPQPAAVTAGARRDRAVKALRTLVRRADAAHRRDAAALAAAISEPGASGSRALVAAASRLRADALDLAAAARRVRTRTNAGKLARAAVLKTQEAAARALGAVRAFGASTDTAVAAGHLASAERALDATTALAAAARRRLGCAKPCGSGFCWAGSPARRAAPPPRTRPTGSRGWQPRSSAAR